MRARAEFKNFFLSFLFWKKKQQKKIKKQTLVSWFIACAIFPFPFLFTFLLPPPLLFNGHRSKWDGNINTTCCSTCSQISPYILTRRPKWWIDLTKEYLIFTNARIMAVCVLILKLLFFQLFGVVAANHLMGYMRIHIHLFLPLYSPPDKFLPFRKSKISWWNSPRSGRFSTLRTAMASK